MFLCFIHVCASVRGVCCVCAPSCPHSTLFCEFVFTACYLFMIWIMYSASAQQCMFNHICFCSICTLRPPNTLCSTPASSATQLHGARPSAHAHGSPTSQSKHHGHRGLQPAPTNPLEIFKVLNIKQVLSYLKNNPTMHNSNAFSE